MSLPNRKARRQAAKEMGLLGKDKTKKESEEISQKKQSLGKFIHLRNLTEQRNKSKK